MTTLMLLLARHDCQEEIPFTQVAREYFRLEPNALERKIKLGKIQFDILVGQTTPVRPKSVSLIELAHYIQERRAAANAVMLEYSIL